MNDPFRSGSPPRVWRQDGGALAAGVCAGLADDLDLPLPLVRIVAVLFLILPTGLAYLALALLLRRRHAGPAAGYADRDGPGRAAGARDAGRRGRSATDRPATDRPATGRPVPVREGWALLRHRFDQLEPRLGRIEAFVTAPDFELHRGFRRMGE